MHWYSCVSLVAEVKMVARHNFRNFLNVFRHELPQSAQQWVDRTKQPSMAEPKYGKSRTFRPTAALGRAAIWRRLARSARYEVKSKLPRYVYRAHSHFTEMYYIIYLATFAHELLVVLFLIFFFCTFLFLFFESWTAMLSPFELASAVPIFETLHSVSTSLVTVHRCTKQVLHFA